MKKRNAFEKALLGDKPTLQGGVYNYLGRQEIVPAPLKWKSAPDHPESFLAYITQEEADLLIKADLYGTLTDGKPNAGPFGIMSLNGGGDGGGDGGGGGGDGGGGGGDAGGGGSAGAGDSGGGGGAGAAGDSGDAGGGGAGAAGAAGDAGEGDAGEGDSEDSEDEEDSTASSPVKTYINSIIANPIPTIIGMVNPVAGLVARAFMSSPSSSTATGPSGPASTTTGGGAGSSSSVNPNDPLKLKTLKKGGITSLF